MVWHWAHVDLEECSPYWEPMTVWHVEWQNEVPEERREIYFKGGHRADIVTKSGCVVEVQHSPIGAEIIRAREDFYGERMVWIWDARKAYEEGRITIKTSTVGQLLLQWAPRVARSVQHSQRKVFLDLGEELFQLEKFSDKQFVHSSTFWSLYGKKMRSLILEKVEDEGEYYYQLARHWSGSFVKREDLVREFNE